jgi:signal transduction histidine kinase/CheY-like chemotaxis protein
MRDLLTVVTARWQQGEYRGAVAVFSDITETKALQRDLASALDRAQTATRAKSEFLANMSHEIRTPMNAIIGLAELLLDAPLPDEQRNSVQLMIESGNALTRVINDILDFSKVEAGHLQLEREPFSLVTLVESTAELLEGAARAKGLPLEIDVDPGLPTLLGDEGRLRQILLNLLGNALKFTVEGRITVRAEGEALTGSRVLVRLDVQDTGIGISREVQTRLFQPFEQAEASTTRRFGGTGLGLALVKRLVDLMGGTVVLASEPGAGSRVRLTLPFDVALPDEPTPAASAEPRARTAPAETAPAETAPDHPRGRVLLAEDNPVNRKVAQLQLGKLGLEIVSVEDGAAAVAAYTMDPAQVDLILMDCQMPILDGFEATRTIRDWEAQQAGALHVPIVAMTANAMAGDREACLAAGMDDYVSKPVHRHALEEAVLRHIRLTPALTSLV